jgi:spermidine/putrescine transport system permease protein
VIRRGATAGLVLFLAPALLWLLLLVVLPQVDLFLLSLRLRGDRTGAVTLANYARFFEEPIYWRTFVRTAVYSLLATALTLLVAFPVAFYIAKVARGRRKGALLLLCLVPFWVSELVRTYGWMILLRESGVVSGLLVATGLAAGRVELLYNDAAIMVGLVYSSILFMVVPLVTVLDTLDDSFVEAAYDLGGGAPSILRHIVLPHAMPGIAAGGIVVFMLTLGNYLTPALLGGKESLWFTEQVYNQFITRFNWEQGSAFGFLLLVLSSGMVWVGLRLTGQTLAGAVGQR